MAITAWLALGGSASASSIVYRCGPSLADLCRVNPDGSGQSQLTSDGQPGTSSAYGSPSLARDGSRLAFAFDGHIVVSDANAANRSAPFATTALVALMRPDGGQVAELERTFTSPAIQLCTYNLDGSGRSCPYGTPSAGWAPDNNLLISVSAGAPNYNLEICHVPVAGPSGAPCDVRADDPAHDLYDPAVSPDGSTLAVTVADGGPTAGHLALYDYATGQFERALTAGPGDNRPAWSPDGTQIAFARGGSIYAIAAAGPPGSERPLVAGDSPTWGEGSAGPSSRLSPPTSSCCAGRHSPPLRLGRLRANRRRGTAALAVTVPGPGRVALSGRGVRSARRHARRAGSLVLPIGRRAGRGGGLSGWAGSRSRSRSPSPPPPAGRPCTRPGSCAWPSGRPGAAEEGRARWRNRSRRWP